MSADEVRDVLLGAADIIRTNKRLARGRIGTRGCCCIFGAMWYATAPSATRTDDLPLPISDRFERALVRFERVHDQQPAHINDADRVHWTRAVEMLEEAAKGLDT